MAVSASTTKKPPSARRLELALQLKKSLPVRKEGSSFWLKPLLAVSALELFELAFDVGPFFRVRQRVLLFSDVLPNFRQFGVQSQVLLLVFGEFILGEDGINWAFRLAQGTIATLIRVDHQKVRAFVDAVHRAHLDAVGVFSLEARVTYHKGHSRTLSPAKMR